MFPFIPVADGVVIPSYFLIISATYMVSIYWLFRRASNHNLPGVHVLDFCFIVMVGGFIGARLMHVFYEHFDYYSQDPMQIFKFWQGGFVFYGGVLGAAIPAYLYVRKKGYTHHHWLNFLAPVLAFGYMMGRFATLLSGSGYGRPTDLPWGIIYPTGPEAPAGISLHPTPIYSILWNFFALLVILVIERKSKPESFWRFQSHLFFLYLIWHALGRLWIEQFRNDFRGSDPLGLSVSSWISVVLISWGAVVLLRDKFKNILEI